MASGNIRGPCLAGLSPARSQPRRHGFSLTDSYRVPWYDYAVTHMRETGLEITSRYREALDEAEDMASRRGSTAAEMMKYGTFATHASSK